jgi:hypothetical protein
MSPPPTSGVWAPIVPWAPIFPQSGNLGAQSVVGRGA